MIGGEIGRPASNSTGPGTPIPIPHSRPGRPCVVSSSESNSASTRPRPCSGPASIRAGSSWWPRIRPSSVVTATSMLVAPRSATRTWPPSAWKVSWRGGRPPVLGPTSPSVTRPRSISSPTRWATMARPRFGPRHQLGARARPPEPDLIEDGDQGVEGLVGQRAVAGRSLADRSAVRCAIGRSGRTVVGRSITPRSYAVLADFCT